MWCPKKPAIHSAPCLKRAWPFLGGIDRLLPRAVWRRVGSPIGRRAWLPGITVHQARAPYGERGRESLQGRAIGYDLGAGAVIVDCHVRSCGPRRRLHRKLGRLRLRGPGRSRNGHDPGDFGFGHRSDCYHGGRFRVGYHRDRRRRVRSVGLGRGRAVFPPHLRRRDFGCGHRGYDSRDRLCVDDHRHQPGIRRDR